LAFLPTFELDIVTHAMPKLDSNNDASLVLLLQKGNLMAFDSLYWKYHKALYANVFKLVKDQGVTEDIVQETFISLWQKKHLLKADSSVSGWLFVNCYHKSVNWQKKKLLEAKMNRIIADKLLEESVPDMYEQQMQLLEKAISQLSPQKRKVFELCKLQGKTYSETAKELNISAHTVKEYLAGAMAYIKEYALAHPEYKLALPVLWVISQ
jgi:RNA polymerase sigma-70 factor (ECF subfamily)